MGNYYYSAKAHGSLVTGLSNARFEDAGGLVNWQRTINLEQETAYGRAAHLILD